MGDGDLRCLPFFYLMVWIFIAVRCTFLQSGLLVCYKYFAAQRPGFTQFFFATIFAATSKASPFRNSSDAFLMI